MGFHPKYQKYDLPSMHSNKDPSPEIWLWYQVICACSLFNIMIYVGHVTLVRGKMTREVYKYKNVMERLAMPYVF